MTRKPSSTEVPTLADVDEYGVEECLAALREEFAAAHARYPQYAGWTEGTTLGVARRRIDANGQSFVRAEQGDLLLVKRDRLGEKVAYAPRVGWNLGACDSLVDEVAVETTYRHVDGLVTFRIPA